MKLKYIIFNDGGSPMPVIFPNIILHRDMKLGDARPISAGFCTIEKYVHGDSIEVKCFGKSVGLDLKSHEYDSDICTEWYNKEGY